jgi:WD40 repeat protein
LTIPQDTKDNKDNKDSSGSWPWTVGKAEEFPLSSPVSFSNLPPFAVTGMAVRPEIKRAVVSYKFERKGQPASTHFAMCDTANGKILTEWPFPTQQMVLDLSADGRALLSTSAQPGKERGILRLSVIGTDGQLRRIAWTAHSPARPTGIRYEIGERMDVLGAQEIKWAGFVGNDRIVSVSRLGQLRVFDTDGAKPLTSVEGSPGRPALSPDGSKVAILTGNAVTLVDPTEGKVIGTRWIGTLPSHPALAFSPDGSKLAIGGNGKAVFLNLVSGDVQEAVIPKLHVTDVGGFDKPFGWAGNSYLFADGHLHDLRLPASIWDYSGAEQVAFQGSSIWACVHPADSTTTTLATFNVPNKETIATLAVATNRPEQIAFKTGDRAKLDVSGIPEQRREEMQTALEQRLQALGYKVDPAATAVFSASIDATGTKAGVGYTGYDTYSYAKKPAVLRLFVNGKDIWSESWAIEPPFTIKVPPTVTLADHLKQFTIGEPNYKLFSMAPIPASFPSPQAPTIPFGTTELGVEKKTSWFHW